MSRPPSRRVVCLGEAIVDVTAADLPADLEALGDSLDGPVRGERFGGSIANVALGATRFGARAELLGGAGADRRGRFLRAALAEAGVGVEGFALIEGIETSRAVVTLDAAGEPSYEFAGEPIEPLLAAAPRLDRALGGEPGLLVVGSDTLVDPPVRELTHRAAALAGERGWRVLYDPNLRPNRWDDRETMLEVVGSLLPAAGAVKCNAAEASELTGERQPGAALTALQALGPELVVITGGGEGVLGGWRGHEPVRLPAPSARVVDATGAGDSVTAVLAAALAVDAPASALPDVLAAAQRAAAGVVASHGAIEGLPAEGWPGWPPR